MTKEDKKENSETVPTVSKPRQTSIKIKKEEDAREMLRERRGERQAKYRKREKEKGKKKRRALGGISRGETESSGRYTAKCRGGFISLSVLFIDVLSASLVPTVARALSFLCRCLYTYIYVATISPVFFLFLSFYGRATESRDQNRARCPERERSITLDSNRETIVCVTIADVACISAEKMLL